MNSDGSADSQVKFLSLLSCLKEAESALLAFSGGVDSTFLLKTMELAGMKILAATSVSDTMPARDYHSAVAFVRDQGIEHIIIRTDELSKEEFARNPPDRCFYCKDELFGKLRQIAEERDLIYIFDGTNSDDLADYRPGRRAAELHRVRSPLAECGFSKNEIRAKSQELGLTTWNQPSSPCLSSRFPYGQRITTALLKRVEAAEEFLRTFGVHEVRVRNHGDTARIEVGEGDMQLLLNPGTRRLVTEKLRALGYKFISLDLEGYRSGSLNRVFADRKN
jgi:uncharacterized protein